MSQGAQGDFNTQISVIGSSYVTVTINGQNVIDLEPRAFPVPLPENPAEIDLLKAAYAQIPFVGREDLVQDFLDWCGSAAPVSCRTVIGRGGAGKTRFAYELYSRVTNLPNWKAYFLHFWKDSARGANLWKEVNSKNALLIADYASDSAAPLADLLRSLNRPAPKGHRIRVLLLARTGDWDQSWLASLRSERTNEDVDRIFHPRDPIDLQPPTPQQRYDIFRQTVARAAQVGSKTVPALPPPEKFAQPDVSERLSDPLTLMMAALITLESDAYSALSLNRTELAYKVAEKLVAGRMMGTVRNHKELFLHMAACATLTGGLSQDDALAVLEQESKETHLGEAQDPLIFLQKLQGWLPGEKSKTWLGTIQPDIVGEAFLLGPYLHGGEHAILRAASRNSGSTTNALVRIAQDFSLLPENSRLEPLQWLTKLVENGEADTGLGTLMELADALPKSSVVLRQLGLRIWSALSVRFRLLYEAADEPLREAVLPYLATALNNLVAMQSEAGQREAALATAQEAVELRRELAGRNRDAFLPDLAGSLNNLANIQSEVGQREAALATAQEAVEKYRELAGWNRDAFLPDLAMSLNNLANRQGAVGQREAALATAQEALELRRELAGRNRDAFLPALATSLSNLANAQSDVGRREAALATAQEAVEKYRELAGRTRDAFLPDLATSLNNLANRQSDMGQREEALATAEEAVEKCRELARWNRHAFLPDLAMSLNNLANMQSAVGQREAALATAQEAVEKYRELMKFHRDAFVQNFAKSCWTLADILHEVGKPAEGQSTYAQAIREVLPEVAKLPAVYVGLAVTLLRNYLERAQAAGLEPDTALITEAMQILGPYLQKEQE